MTQIEAVSALSSAGVAAVMAGAASCGAAIVWRARRANQLHWREWGGDSVVFDGRTGHTHQMSPLVAAVMAWLEESARDAHGLATQVAQHLDLAPEDLQATVAEALQALQDLDWIEPVGDD